MSDAIDPAHLMPGETLLFSWEISGRSFFLRAGAIVGVWVIIGQIGSLGQNLTATLAALPVAAIFGVFYMWVFGELDIWARNRGTVWHLTNRALHIVLDDDLPLRLPLTEIQRINRWPLWSLVLRLSNGTATTLPIPPDPRSLRARILTARDCALPEAAR